MRCTLPERRSLDTHSLKRGCCCRHCPSQSSITDELIILILIPACRIAVRKSQPQRCWQGHTGTPLSSRGVLPTTMRASSGRLEDAMAVTMLRNDDSTMTSGIDGVHRRRHKMFMMAIRLHVPHKICLMHQPPYVFTVPQTLRKISKSVVRPTVTQLISMLGCNCKLAYARDASVNIVVDVVLNVNTIARGVLSTIVCMPACRCVTEPPDGMHGNPAACGNLRQRGSKTISDILFLCQCRAC